MLPVGATPARWILEQPGYEPTRENAVHKIIISSNPENLTAANPDITIEAEFGGLVVEGRLLTLAHHGERSHNPPPSTRPNGLVEGAETVGVSHIDLDTLGGILSVAGTKPVAPGFWTLAGFVDLNGAHKLGESKASDADLRRLHAYWAGAEALPVYAPRDGSVDDVTEGVSKLAALVALVLADDEATLVAGDAHKAAKEALNSASFVRLEGGIILRQSGSFVNHLYVTPSGEVARAVVTRNPSEDVPNGAITASLADPVEGVNVGTLLGEVFGPEAGGHAGIGGSPRGIALTFADAERFTARLAEALA